MTLPLCPKSSKPSLTFIANKHTHTVNGQVAKALNALVAAQDGGITAQEVAGWAFRLAAYVFILRTEYGLTIITKQQKHKDGWHARYVLSTPVTPVQ